MVSSCMDVLIHECVANVLHIKNMLLKNDKIKCLLYTLGIFEQRIGTNKRLLSSVCLYTDRH